MNKFKEFVYEKYNIPPDVLGSERIVVTGNREIYVENYNSVAHYAPNEIVLATQTGLLHICGKNLTITELCRREIFIRGVFEKIHYEI